MEKELWKECVYRERESVCALKMRDRECMCVSRKREIEYVC